MFHRDKQCITLGTISHNMGKCIVLQSLPTLKFEIRHVRRRGSRHAPHIQASATSTSTTPLQKDGKLKPIKQQVTAFAPATIANLGPGFDWLGCAVDVSGPFQSFEPRCLTTECYSAYLVCTSKSVAIVLTWPSSSRPSNGKGMRKSGTL